MAKVIAILTSKGGVGKTQTALEVATVLGMNGSKVLCIDMDGQRNLSQMMNCDNKRHTIYDCLSIDAGMTYEDIQEIMDDATHHCKYIDIINGSTKMAKADKYFPDSEDMFLLKEFCDNFLEDKYDYVIIDNPPARNVLNDMSIIASDYALLITDGSEAARRGIAYVLDDIEKYKFDKRYKWSEIEVLGVVMTKYKGRSVHYMVEGETYRDDVVNEIEQRKLGKDIFVRTVREAVEVMEAGAMHKSCQEYKEYGNVARDYRDVTREIMKRV